MPAGNGRSPAEAGLGLSIVAAIVRRPSGGRVELRTEPGCGAAFRVVLPALDWPPLLTPPSMTPPLTTPPLMTPPSMTTNTMTTSTMSGAANEPAESAMSYAASRRTGWLVPGGALAPGTRVRNSGAVSWLRMGTAIVGRYVLLGRSAYGGVSVVYQAVDTMRGRRSAIKLLAPAFADDPLRPGTSAARGP